MLIAATSALDLMQSYAPRTWCKRILQWQVFTGSLVMYFTAGEIVWKRQAGYYLLDMFESEEEAKPSLTLVRQEFGAEIESALRNAGCPEEPNVLACWSMNVFVEVDRETWTDEA